MDSNGRTLNNLSCGFLTSESEEIYDEISPVFLKEIVKGAIFDKNQEKDREKIADSERINPKTQVNKEGIANLQFEAKPSLFAQDNGVADSNSLSSCICNNSFEHRSRFEGILPVSKPKFKTSFSLVGLLRKITCIRTIGHAGTLDPFAEGVMILLIGKPYTKLSNEFLHQDKEYLATLHLGVVTDTYDIEGKIISQNSLIPSLLEIEEVLLKFQGTILQTPPMFSAKKVEGKKLYELARKGITIERKAVPVTLQIEVIDYSYPYLKLKVNCSKGTYLRTLAYDIGCELGCGAHLSSLTRTRSGTFTLKDCCDGARMLEPDYIWESYLKRKFEKTQK